MTKDLGTRSARVIAPPEAVKEHLMPKPEVADEKPYRPDWKYIGIGVVVGMLLLTLLIASGGRVENGILES